MKFSLTIINKNPSISIGVKGIPGVEERICVVGRELHATEPIIRLDAERIIEMEQALERLIGVRVHISEHQLV